MALPRKTEDSITAEYLRSVLRYNPSTGKFIWLEPRPRIAIGTEAGCMHKPTGRWKIRINGITYFRSRLAWLYMKGAWPLGQVDHLNTDPGDDRWKNLRDGSARSNKENSRRPHRRNKLGLLGVWQRGDRFAAHITVNYKTRHIGTYDTPEEAYAAYLTAKRALHEGNTL